MDDARRLGGAERTTELQRQSGRLVVRERTAILDPARQRLAVEQLHGEERQIDGAAVAGRSRMNAEVEDPADVRMRDAAGEQDFAFEALDGVQVAERRAQKLERQSAAELAVEGAVDLADRALTEKTVDTVAPRDEGASLKGRQRGSGHRAPGVFVHRSGSADARRASSSGVLAPRNAGA